MSAPARLLSVAERLVEAWPAELGREIAVTGSLGAGVADEFSDVELLLLVDRVPEPASVARWLETVGAVDTLAGSDSSGTWAWCRVDGVEVEPYWGNLGEARDEAAAIASGDVVEHGRLGFAHVATHWIVLRSDGALAELERTLAAYPESLRRRLVEDAVAGLEIPSPRLGAAQRGDRLSVEGFLVANAHRILRLVFALNRRWEPPRWKWATTFAASLELAPDRLGPRLVEPLVEPNALAAVRAMLELLDETLALVPPELDVEAARRGTERRLAAVREAA